MKERRKFPRLNIAAVVVNWAKLGKEKMPCLNRAKNISESGFCLLLDRQGLVNAGDILGLKFKLPAGKAVQVKGKIIWVNIFEAIGKSRHEAGVEFINISRENRKAIERFIFPANRLPNKYLLNSV